MLSFYQLLIHKEKLKGNKLCMRGNFEMRPSKDTDTDVRNAERIVVIPQYDRFKRMADVV